MFTILLVHLRITTAFPFFGRPSSSNVSHAFALMSTSVKYFFRHSALTRRAVVVVG